MPRLIIWRGSARGVTLWSDVCAARVCWHDGLIFAGVMVRKHWYGLELRFSRRKVYP